MQTTALTTHDITASYRLYAANSLEAYRCETFFTKEPETVKWIEEFFRPKDILIDIGANVGVYSLYAALLYPEVTVYSIEPFLKNYQRLCDNIDLNGIENVVPLLMALSDSTAIDHYYIRDERTGSSGNQVGDCVDEHGNRFVAKQTRFIPAYRLDDFIAAFALPCPNHIKIDVDGIEGRIVSGMQQTLANPALRSVLVEINRGTEATDTISACVEGYGFTTDNRFNCLPDHSRHRRKGTPSESAENVIFTRQRQG